jgi:hypothetical protein
MTTRPRDVDQLVTSLRAYVQALIDREQIAGHETVTAAQADLRDAFKRVLGMKVAEDAEL